MNTLIDGYNLIFDIGFISDRESKTRFEKARKRLIRELAMRLPTLDRRETLIVFDAANAPPGLPDAFEEEQIAIRFAVGYPEADDFIEILIKQHSAPKKLLVVSSDHRLQRAAAARKAKFEDSQDWFDRIKPHHQTQTPPPASVSPSGITEAEQQEWLQEFETPDESTSPQPPRRDSQTSPPPEPTENPFPPGYTDDLFDEG